MKNGENSDKMYLPDLSVLGPPGSGSFHHQAKIISKTLISIVLADFFMTFFYL